MPWHISNKAEGCSGYAVVKDDTNEVVACHKTKADAVANMQALYASEADKMDMSGGPNSPTARNAQQGVPSGMPNTNGKKKKIPVQKAEGLRKEYDMESDQTDMHDWEGLNERQSDMADAYCEVVMEYGQFDQTSGPDGAHYGDGSKNPFKSDGLKCSSCIFFEDGACHLVSGQIDPEGVCKLWIIPESGGADSMEQDQIDVQSEDNIDEIQKKDYSTQERNRMAHAGQAMADGSYPIATEQDLRNAIQSYGRASDPEAVKRHIISRARALGRVDLIPESWNVKKSDSPWGGNFIPQ